MLQVYQYLKLYSQLVEETPSTNLDKLVQFIRWIYRKISRSLYCTKRVPQYKFFYKLFHLCHLHRGMACKQNYSDQLIILKSKTINLIITNQWHQIPVLFTQKLLVIIWAKHYAPTLWYFIYERNAHNNKNNDPQIPQTIDSLFHH